MQGLEDAGIFYFTTSIFQVPCPPFLGRMKLQFNNGNTSSKIYNKDTTLSASDHE